MAMGWRLKYRNSVRIYNNNMSSKTSPIALSGSMLYIYTVGKETPFSFTHTRTNQQKTKNSKLVPPRLMMICAEAIAKDEKCLQK